MPKIQFWDAVNKWNRVYFWVYYTKQEVHGVAKSRTWLSNWTELNTKQIYKESSFYLVTGLH